MVSVSGGELGFEPIGGQTGSTRHDWVTAAQPPWEQDLRRRDAAGRRLEGSAHCWSDLRERRDTGWTGATAGTHRRNERGVGRSGFGVRNDVDYGGMRSIMVDHAEQPGTSIVLEPAGRRPPGVQARGADCRFASSFVLTRPCTPGRCDPRLQE